MKRKNTTRSALLTSIISLLLCVSMLVGTTFAWFTDEVKSGTNLIAAGNLDVELYHSDKDDKNEKVTGSTVLFDDIQSKLWEPGVVVYENFVVANEGTLALKYQLSINFENETFVNGHGLSEALKVAVVKGGFKGDREDAKQLTNLVSLESFVLSGKLEGDQKSETYGIVIYWEPTENDNWFNMNNENRGMELSIDLGVNLFATQEMYEEDSFGEDYDGGAPWVGNIDINWYTKNPDAPEFVLNSAEELAGFAAIVNGTATNDMMRSSTMIHDDFAGQIVKLGGNVDLAGKPWTPIGRIGTSSTDFTYSFKGTFDGQNHTIHNLDVKAYGWAGVFGLAHGAEIKNLKVNGAAIVANRLAGAIVGQLYGSIDNCHVSKAQIMVTPNAVDGGYDNGDKVGGIVGWLGDNNEHRTLTNCSATDVELSAYRDVGGIAGYVSWSTKIANNKADGIEIAVDQVSHFYGEKDPNAGAIWGRNSVSNSGEGVIDENNTKGENISIISTISKNGITYKHNGVENSTALYMVPADYEGTTVNVAEGTTAIGGYAFAYNSNIEKIVLPASVTTLNDRAFRDTSASEIILNEGLTNISWQAFRNALNVTSVKIPASVTTISKEAFQYSGITTLTIPATVTTVDYGACRDMKMVETVIIEGNVDIPVYAFRACTNLKTVILKGTDVTFGGGSRGMIFTNKENGDGSAITVYVVNETVKERLLAADTAAKDYGGYKIVVGLETVEDTDNLAGSFSDGADTVFVPTGKYTFPASSLSKGDTIICAPGTVFEGKSAMDINGATVIGATFSNPDGVAGAGTIHGTFKDCVFEGSEVLRWCYSNEGETVVFENCVFKTDFRGVHFDNMKGNVIFRNCEINGFNAIGGDGTVTFEGCTFGCDESRYNGLNMYSNTVLIDCEFNYVSGKTNFIDFEKAGKSLTITNCSATLDGEAADVLDFVGGTYVEQTTITVDGATLARTAAELQAALNAGAKEIGIMGNITLTQGLAATDVTFVGVGENAGINFNGHNIGGSNTITYKNLKLSTISLQYSPEVGERYGWYGGIDYRGHSVANYENCTISGVFTTYSKVINATNCTFDYYVQDGEEFYNIFMYSACKLTATNCTFVYGDRAIKAYSEAFNQYELILDGCKFVADEGYSLNKALINVSNGNLKLTVKNNDVDEKLKDLDLYKIEGGATVTMN